MFISRGGAGGRVSPDSWFVGGFYHGLCLLRHQKVLFFVKISPAKNLPRDIGSHSSVKTACENLFSPIGSQQAANTKNENLNWDDLLK